VSISDAYIVQYLLDGTSELPAQVHWCEKDSERFGYVARVESVDLILEPMYSRAGSHLILRFRHNTEEFSIIEPAGGGWLGRRTTVTTVLGHERHRRTRVKARIRKSDEAKTNSLS